LDQRLGENTLTNIKRYYIPESIVFITCVTNDRAPLLINKKALEIFWNTLESVKSRHPFDHIAYAILPDHFHWLIRPLDEFGNYSKIIHSFKRNFTLNYKKAKGINRRISIWQDKYWDHIIRDEGDFLEHVKYIHWNAVKHELAASPEDWEQSSYIRWQDSPII
jgi:putative transposase